MIVADISHALRALEKVEGGVGLASRLAGQIVAEELEAESKLAFREEADPVTGKPWAKRKAADPPGKQRALLVKRGRLKGGINAKAFVRGGGEVLVEGAVVGSAHEYALTHQHGDTARNIPQRSYMGLSDEDWKRAGDRILKAVEKAAGL